MNAGKLRHRIKFLRPATEQDRLGGFPGEWVESFSAWAQISPVSGKEYLTQMRETVVTHKVYCRYRSDVTPRMRIEFGDRKFRIVSVLNWDERNVGLTIMCEELVK